jgi:hypothetical protein
MEMPTVQVTIRTMPNRHMVKPTRPQATNSFLTNV